jgi:hypothetical protein
LPVFASAGFGADFLSFFFAMNASRELGVSMVLKIPDNPRILILISTGLETGRRMPCIRQTPTEGEK